MTVTNRQAVARALADAMDGDPDVFVLGEDVGAAGGVFKTSEGLFDRFGPERVLDTPIAEQAIVGCAIGAAAKGLRPVAEIMFADFAGVCFDQIVNQLAKYRYMTDGQVSLPVTIRLANGAGLGYGAQHSQSVDHWFLGTAGLKIVAPAVPSETYSLLRAAIDDPDPVLFFEHKALYSLEGAAEEDAVPAIGRARVVRDGDAVTVVANQLMRVRALEAAENLAAAGVSVQVIDPVTLAPFDYETVGDAVDGTHRLVCVQEALPSTGWGPALVARVVRDRFESLDAPPLIVAPDETPIPYAKSLEDAWLPSVEKISAAITATLEY